MRPRPRVARALLTVFAVLAAVHLVALLVRTATGSGGGAHAVADAAVLATKPALMPVLAGYALTRGGPPLLAGALLLGCSGDTLLQIGGDLLFLLGMAAFAAGHVCYLVVFARHGTAPGRARTAAAAGAYVLAWAALVALLWPGLPADLRGPVAGYSLLLTGMAFGSLRIGPLAAAGGLLFLLSDTLIATGIADWPQAPAPQFWVMLTYIAAQSALALGLLRTAGNTAPAPSAEAQPVQV
ncbi:lysoplasmalogenase family protein [Streptomyces sp. NPDC014733]|uniref:lysoplasmalogenase family protein n=1 Tax=Streptomyces sp. NPDC014733 TaxID=3364885 RepID=UPI0036F96183